jgi:hypothetical protein
MQSLERACSKVTWMQLPEVPVHQVMQTMPDEKTRNCQCGGSNEYCQFCGGTGVIEDVAEPHAPVRSVPRRVGDKPSVRSVGGGAPAVEEHRYQLVYPPRGGVIRIPVKVCPHCGESVGPEAKKGRRAKRRVSDKCPHCGVILTERQLGGQSAHADARPHRKLRAQSRHTHIDPSTLPNALGAYPPKPSKSGKRKKGRKPKKNGRPKGKDGSLDGGGHSDAFHRRLPGSFEGGKGR